MKVAAVLACVAAAAVTMPSVEGHGYMITPKAQLASGDPTRYYKEVRGSTLLQVPAGGSFSNSPSVNLDSFTKAYKSSSFKSLKELFSRAGADGCGITPAGGSAQPVPDAVEWSSFVDSHVGPCEVWCDNTRVFQNDNCATFTSRPAKLPINKSQCSGASQLRFIWLALHSQDWQFYIACAPLQGAGSGPRPAPAPAPAPQPQPNPAPAPRPNPAPAPRPNPAPAPSPVVRPTPAPPSNNNGGNTGGDADCDEYPEPEDDCDDLPDPDDIAGEGDDCDDDLPEPDCDDDLPEPDADCDDDLPEPDCDDDLPVAGNDQDEYGGEADNLDFSALQRGSKYTPGKAVPENEY